MDQSLTEVLKRDVAKWEEAARAIEDLIPKMTEPDRAHWAERVKWYRSNASEIRGLLEQISKRTAIDSGS